MLIGKKPCWDPYLPIFSLSWAQCCSSHGAWGILLFGYQWNFSKCQLLCKKLLSLSDSAYATTVLRKNEKPIFTEQEPKNQQARLRIRISTRQPFHITLPGLLKGALVWRENVFSWGRMLIGTRRAVEQLVLNLFTAKSTILIISVVGGPVGPAALTA